MRWIRERTDDQKKRDLRGRIKAVERELHAADEAGDPLAKAVALNNLGAAHADLEEWAEALERYEAAAAAVPETASLEERATPHGNAANAARRLDRWAESLAHAVWVDALATEAGDNEQQAVAEAAVTLVRKAIGADELAKLLDDAVAALPEALRAQVRLEAHLHPTAAGEARPGRNDPCWCGSGKKYKFCHMSEDSAQAQT